MCGRYAATLPPEMMAELFKLLKTVETVPRYNIAPTQPIVAIWEESGRREAHFARWGLVPRWVKDPREFPLLVNARAESMLDKAAFRDPLKHGRCIVPASGYYEWHTNPDKTKQPYYITRADGEPMALAGLYATWVGPDGKRSTASPPLPSRPIRSFRRSTTACRPFSPARRRRTNGSMCAKCGRMRRRNWPCRCRTGCCAIIRVAAGELGAGRRSGLIEEVRPEKPEPPAPKTKKAASGGGQLDLF